MDTGFLKRAVRFVFAWLLLLGCNFGVLAGEAGVLRVVSDENYPPYLFRNADGRVEGYLVDLWQLWQSKTGIKVELTATNWANAQKMIARGEADVIDMI